ncbi:RNA pyrophosphohydrolase [Albirhodobacter sp. R86504]|jgi:putative (di)nucleoside polyphosphate hydrolase|uniref:RNA pyrophosphohydrolase n=1 Tax=Albirhodobacter sp. R86504 TaxID=3093848 RepID=UPI00366A5E48
MTPQEIEKMPYRPCVGIVLVNQDGKIFAGLRLDNPTPAWQMPQGGIDDGEKPKEAALRELWEETGVTSDLVEIIAKTDDWITYDLPTEMIGKIWKGRYRGQKQKWFLMRYSGTDAQVNIASEHPEFSQWAWKEADEIIASIVPFKRAVYEDVIGRFREHI